MTNAVAMTSNSTANPIIEATADTAWVRGATEADIAVIQSAMNRKKSAADCTRSQEARSAKSPVARLGTRLATGLQAPKAQLTEILAKLKWRRGWDGSAPDGASALRARRTLRSGVQRRAARGRCRTLSSITWVRIPARPGEIIKGPLRGPFYFTGGEGGIRTHVPELPDHPISSRRRYDHFGTSPFDLRSARVDLSSLAS